MHKNNNIKLIFLFISVLLVSCGGSGGDGGAATMTERVPEPAGLSCSNGGVAVILGVDTDGDGTLTVQDQITSVTYECNDSKWQSAEFVGDGLIDLNVQSNGSYTLFYWWGLDQYMDRYNAASNTLTNTLIPHGQQQVYSSDSAGNAVAVWPDLENNFGNVWASKYNLIDGWQLPEKIALSDTIHVPSLSQIPEVDVVMLDDLDSALMVSRYSGVNNWMAHSNIYTQAGNWGLPESIEVNTAYTPSSMPEISKDGNGNVFAVWYRGARIYANRYSYLTGWGGAVIIDAGTATGDCKCGVVASTSGKAFAYWLESGSHWGNFYTPGSGWGGAFPLDITARLVELSIAFNNNDELLISWHGRVLTTESIWVTQVSDAANQTHTELFNHEYTSLNQLYEPKISTDNYGNIVVVWYRYGSYWSSHYSVQDTQWSNPELISTETVGRGDNFIVKMYGNGAAMVAWDQEDLIAPGFYANGVWFKKMQL